MYQVLLHICTLANMAAWMRCWMSKRRVLDMGVYGDAAAVPTFAVINLSTIA